MARQTSSDVLRSRMRSYDRRRFLRPMRTAEMIDLAARIYRQTGRHLIGYTIAPMTLSLAALFFFSSFLFPNLFQTDNPDSISAQFGEFAVAMAGSVFIAAPLLIIGLTFSIAFATRISSLVMIGENPDPSRAWEDAKRGVLAAGLTFMRSLLISAGVGLLALVLVGVSALLQSSGPTEDSAAYFIMSSLAFLGVMASFIMVPVLACRTALSVPVAVVENARPKDAVKRAMALSKGMRGIPSAYESLISGLLLLGFFGLIIYGGLALTLALFDVGQVLRGLTISSLWTDVLQASVQVLPIFLAILVLTPLWGILVTVLYYDRRVRLEAYDVEVMANDILETDDRHVRLA